MNRQALVIGLGQFGLGLSRSLEEKGVEVLAVDTNPERVRLASAVVTDAVCLDATDEVALGTTGPERRDVCVCAIGDEALEASIITTALLRQLGGTRVVARATHPLHERILRLVGAHDVVNPERAFGERYAMRLLYQDVMDELLLGPDLVLTELKPPPSLVGRTLIELELPRRFEITVVAIRLPNLSEVILPNPTRRIEEQDLLLVVSRPGAVARLLEKLS